MVVWFAHVRVGHRQLSILKYPPTSYLGGGFSLCASFIPSDLRIKSYLKNLLLRCLKLACNFYGALFVRQLSILDKATFANAKVAFLCVEFGDNYFVSATTCMRTLLLTKSQMFSLHMCYFGAKPAP